MEANCDEDLALQAYKTKHNDAAFYVYQRRFDEVSADKFSANCDHDDLDN
jgi:hypothetical protein